MIKREATLAMGAEVVLVGPASSERLAKAQELSSQHGYRIIPPYDHPAIIAGQGTCGLEIVEQMGLVEESPQGLKPPSLSGDVYGTHSTALRAGSEAVPLSKTKDKVVVLSPVSGGGLLSGIATAAKLAAPGRTQVWAAEPELAADATESFRPKKLVEWPAEKTTRTICDGLRTQSMGVLNFAHVMRYVDGMVNVSEDEILRAMRIMLTATDLVPEPSGAVTFAAALFHHGELPPCERMVAVLSGGNIDPALKAKLEADASARAVAGV